MYENGSGLAGLPRRKRNVLLLMQEAQYRKPAKQIQSFQHNALHTAQEVIADLMVIFLLSVPFQSSIPLPYLHQELALSRVRKQANKDTGRPFLSRSPGGEGEKAKKEQLLAEWKKFKFDMDSWKQEIPEGMNESHLETAPKWCLKRLISLKTTNSTVFPALAKTAEVCLSMPVSNAWPERGCSALKRIKTRLRNRLGVMLQALLMSSVNGPQVGTPECKALIAGAMEKRQPKNEEERCQRGMKGSHCHLPVHLQCITDTKRYH